MNTRDTSYRDRLAAGSRTREGSATIAERVTRATRQRAEHAATLARVDAIWSPGK